VRCTNSWDSRYVFFCSPSTFFLSEKEDHYKLQLHRRFNSHRYNNTFSLFLAYSCRPITLTSCLLVQQLEQFDSLYSTVCTGALQKLQDVRSRNLSLIWRHTGSTNATLYHCSASGSSRFCPGKSTPYPQSRRTCGLQTQFARCREENRAAPDGNPNPTDQLEPVTRSITDLPVCYMDPSKANAEDTRILCARNVLENCGKVLHEMSRAFGKGVSQPKPENILWYKLESKISDETMELLRIFALPKAWIVGSNPTQGMDVSLRLFSVCVVLYR
jgi:hypothetical protein